MPESDTGWSKKNRKTANVGFVKSPMGVETVREYQRPNRLHYRQRSAEFQKKLFREPCAFLSVSLFGFPHIVQECGEQEVQAFLRAQSETFREPSRSNTDAARVFPSVSFRMNFGILFCLSQVI